MTSFNIYDHANQAQIDNFKPTFLYIKQHSVTGKLYFGKTVRTGKSFEQYKGSGKYWTNHIDKHGRSHVKTIWYCLYIDIESLVEAAISLSESLDIVRSEQWLNQMNENGLGGTIKGRKIMDTTNVVSSAKKRAMTEEGKAHIVALGKAAAKVLTGVPRTQAVKDAMARGRKPLTQAARDAMSKAMKGKPGRPGMFTAKDRNGNLFYINKEDPRWVSGELVGLRKKL